MQDDRSAVDALDQEIGSRPCSEGRIRELVLIGFKERRVKMAGLNARERFHAVMRFEPEARTLLWEFGYWTATVERWYGEGLRRSPFSPPPGFPSGAGVFGDALPFPHMPSLVRYRDIDIHKLLGFDDGTVRVPLNWRHSPPFEEIILEEDETTRLMVNLTASKSVCARPATRCQSA